MILTELEYNTLDSLATKTKMDCWFSIQQDKDGDYVYDIENDKRMSLKDGIYQFVEALVLDELTESEKIVIIELLLELM